MKWELSLLVLLERLHECYLKQTKPMCETKLNELIARNPKLINCLKRNTCHPLIRKYSDIPFNDDNE